MNALETRGLFIFLENKRIFSCQILRSFNVIPASLEVNLPMFASRLPKPNDSNGYRERLIYLFCNNYLTFHVFKTSFKEVMSSSYILRRKDVKHFDWFFDLTWGNSCLVFFTHWFPVQIMLLFHVERLPTTKSFIVNQRRIYLIFLRVTSIP